MRKSFSTSHRISCVTFALAVVAALYSIGTLVYGSDPVIAGEYAAPQTHTAAARDTSGLPTRIKPVVINEDNDESEFDKHTEDDIRTQEEEWPADVLAELAGKRKGDVAEFDPDQPPVTGDNVHAAPTGEFADQILAGEVNASSSEGAAFGFDPDMVPPEEDNAGVTPNLEFADQIRQEDIESTAMLSGYIANEESYIKLQDVDESTAPPTETGASIDPEAHVSWTITDQKTVEPDGIK